MTATTVPVPEWLALRDGGLTPGIRDFILFVTLGGKPNYRLEARPAAGKFICAVTQTNNGKRLDDATVYPNETAALAGGLEQLRTKLGW